MFRILLFVFVSTILSACSSVSHVKLYDGPQLSKHQEAQIILPEHFDIIEFNGYPVKAVSLRFRAESIPLTLPPGEHVIALQYSDIWNIDEENHDTLSSGHIIFKVVAKAGEIFELKHSSINSYEQAVLFAKAPNVQLVSGFQSVKGSHLKKANPLVFNQKQSNPVRYPNLEQLKFWWNQATHYERNEFRLWLNRQD